MDALFAVAVSQIGLWQGRLAFFPGPILPSTVGLVGSLVNESDTFTGRFGYLIREGFVRYLAAATQRPGIFVWLGKRRYEHAQHRQQVKAKKHAMQLHRVR
jgi:hypothetical protein